MRQLIDCLNALQESGSNLSEAEALAELNRVFAREPYFRLNCPLGKVRPAWLRRGVLIGLLPVVVVFGVIIGVAEMVSEWFHDIW